MSPLEGGGSPALGGAVPGLPPRSSALPGRCRVPAEHTVCLSSRNLCKSAPLVYSYLKNSIATHTYETIRTVLMSQSLRCHSQPATHVIRKVMMCSNQQQLRATDAAPYLAATLGCQQSGSIEPNNSYGECRRHNITTERTWRSAILSGHMCLQRGRQRQLRRSHAARWYARHVLAHH